VVTSFRLFATVGLLWALATRTDLSHAAQLMAQVALPLLAATLVALLGANLVGAVRWHLVLSAEAASPGPAVLLKIVLVGLFFNQVLPTGVGGDAVRVWRCCRLGIGLGTALRSILLDRACGYLVLIVAFAASLPGLLHILTDPRQKALLVVMLGAGLLGLVALFVLDRLPRPLLNLRLIAPLAELSRGSRRLFAKPARCGVVLGLSAFTIGLTILAFKLAADGIGIRLSFGSWLAIVPPVTLLQLLPISLAGWGVREVALVVVLASFGIPTEAALATSVLLGFCMIVIGLPGGLIWLANWDIAQPQVLATANAIATRGPNVSPAYAWGARRGGAAYASRPISPDKRE
jgi:glycosyltransferase 2 family protein